MFEDVCGLTSSSAPIFAIFSKCGGRVDLAMAGRRLTRIVQTGQSTITKGWTESSVGPFFTLARRRRRIKSHRATFEVAIGPGEQASLFVSVSCEEAEAPALGNFFLAYRDTRRARRASTANIATVETSNGLFDEVMCRATSDVYTLITRTDLGPYPYAGIPWFNTIFGRDGIITAMFMLWVDPTVARGVLRTLAATQATEFDPKSDAQPGKILHERRLGEMANLGEVPFRRYYGSVDATPLFLLLAGMYFERTGDMETIAAIWPNIEAALAWIDVHGDQDGDGFVEYFREIGSGLANQGWKDSI